MWFYGTISRESCSVKTDLMNVVALIVIPKQETVIAFKVANVQDTHATL